MSNIHHYCPRNHRRRQYYEQIDLGICMVPVDLALDTILLGSAYSQAKSQTELPLFAADDDYY